MSDHDIDDLDLEQVFTASMTDYVDRFEVPAFRPVRLRKPVWPRRVAMGVAVAAMVGVASGVAVLDGSDASPAAPGTTGSPSPSPSPRPTMNPSAAVRPGGVVGALVFDAELYQNPATRSRVDLNAVRALFVDDSAFQHYWGTDARGVTCGKIADGAVETGTRVEYLHGAESTPWDAIVTLDGTSSAISGITCVPHGNATQPPASYAVMGYYGYFLDAFRMTDIAAQDNAISVNEENELSESLHAAKDIFAASTCSTKHFSVWFGYGSTGDPQHVETLHIVTDVASPFTVTTGLVGGGSGGIASVDCNTPQNPTAR